MKQKFTLLLLLAVFSTLLWSQVPVGYYSLAEGKSEAALKTQLSSIISANYVDVGYSGLYTIYVKSDILSNGKVWDMYSLKADGTAEYYYTHSVNNCGNYTREGDCYNREHTFCDSWLGEVSPQRSDAHHLVPSDGYVNNKRGSFAHGKVGVASWTSTNGSKLGSSDSGTGYSGTVFEPIDEYKGDFARMYFYVATRYESLIASWVNNGTANQILDGSAYPAYKSWFLNLMLAWHRQDPVSRKEIDRNNAIFESQKNRNPYIDNPTIAEHIWGTLKGQAWTQTANVNPYLINPMNGNNIDFGIMTYQQTKSINVDIKGQNLTGDISVALSGTNETKFKLSTNTITKAQAESGYVLTITYDAFTIGAHVATVNITGGGINGTILNLKAECKDSFEALPATNINSTSFTANWTTSGMGSAYTINVYTVQASNTNTYNKIFEEEFNTGLPTGWTSTGYVDNQTSGNMKLASGSQNGAIITPEIDLTKQTKLTIKARQYNNDAGAKLNVILGAATLESLTTASSIQTFTVLLPVQNAPAKVTLSAISGKRVFIESVKAETESTLLTENSVNGYPKNVGNVLNYNVSDLQANTDYFYKVYLENNSSTISAAIAVRTSVLSGFETQNKLKYTWTKTKTGVKLNHINPTSTLDVYDCMGRKLTISKLNNTDIELNKSGIYFVKIKTGNYTETVKIMY